jgi:hypothetical protein
MKEYRRNDRGDGNHRKAHCPGKCEDEHGGFHYPSKGWEHLVAGSHSQQFGHYPRSCEASGQGHSQEKAFQTSLVETSMRLYRKSSTREERRATPALGSRGCASAQIGRVGLLPVCVGSILFYASSRAASACPIRPIKVDPPQPFSMRGRSGLGSISPVIRERRSDRTSDHPPL